MPAELLTPCDEITGNPLPIRPREVLPDDEPGLANLHHPYHPASALELQTPGGLALRHSGIQLVRATDHNIGDKRRGKLTYHDFYKGPILPNNEYVQARRCLIACAGDIPTKAIDLSGDEPRVVNMTPAELTLLRMPARVKPVSAAMLKRVEHKAIEAYGTFETPITDQASYVTSFLKDFVAKQAVQAGFSFHHLTYRYEPIRDFLRQFTINQNLDHVNEVTIEEFLLTKDLAKKKFLGHWLLAHAMDVATDGIQPVYDQLRSMDRLHPRMPSKSRVLLRYKLGTPEHRDVLTRALETTLANRYYAA